MVFLTLPPAGLVGKGPRNDVRFASESGHVQCSTLCPLSANSGRGVRFNQGDRNEDNPRRSVA
jgi:hypothetical protein